MDSMNTISSLTFLRNPSKTRNSESKSFFLNTGRKRQVLGSAGFMLFIANKQYVTSLAYIFSCW